MLHGDFEENSDRIRLKSIVSRRGCELSVTCKITVKLQKFRERLAHGVVEMAHFLNYDALAPFSLHSKIVKSLSSVVFFFGGFKMMHCFAGN